MADCEKLRDPHLNVSADPADGEVERVVDVVGNEEPVENLDGLRRLLEGFAGCPPPARESTRTLDLIGHSDQTRLLHLGRSVVDPRQESVRSQFEQIAASGIVEHLNISELRLLGCETAMSVEGQAAIRTLSQILGIRVLGTTKLLYAAYFGEDGLKRRYEPVLSDAANLPDLAQVRTGWPSDPLPPPAPRFELDNVRRCSIDELPMVDWPRVRRLAGTGRAPTQGGDIEQLLDLIEKDSGRLMPKLLARPRCEILVISGGDRVRRIEILFDFELVRIRPADAPGSAVYRVKDARRLEDWIDSLGFS
ncbi:MAG TPA: hypothetical protein VKB80_34540 [Kofleriaceae bacterium]|nr:hypothetical protein [Kofleriaceae bacterium]